MSPIDPVILERMTGTERPPPRRRPPSLWSGLAYLIGPGLTLINMCGYALAKGDAGRAKAYSIAVSIEVSIMVVVTWLTMGDDDREDTLIDAIDPRSTGVSWPLTLLMGPEREPAWAGLARLGVALGIVLVGVLVWRHGWGVLRWW